ncbi:MAG: hypothetical protein ACREBV_02960 [Candidatus Zixiibacteriota bacterium]
MLNKLHLPINQSSPVESAPVLKQTEGTSRMVWIPTHGGLVSLNNLLIQIETAARKMFRNENHNTNELLDKVNKVFLAMARDLIDKNTKPALGADSKTKNDNAKPAQADTKE